MKKVMRNGREFEEYTAKELGDYFKFASKNNIYAPDDFCIYLEECEDYYILELLSLDSPYECTKFKLLPDDFVYLTLNEDWNFGTCELDFAEEKGIEE